MRIGTRRIIEIMILFLMVVMDKWKRKEEGMSGGKGLWHWL